MSIPDAETRKTGVPAWVWVILAVALIGGMGVVLTCGVGGFVAYRAAARMEALEAERREEVRANLQKLGEALHAQQEKDGEAIVPADSEKPEAEASP